ncbi:MAG: 50S ribosomal protein L24 [Candidatus Melainabacteria bacterium RIFOXYA12_FULL_32_12]|nr:MAG: 50S ribosomal protein L24 [Candidatus Melainabacteria bacterium GWF2_32_7]OGI22672.1 MAG: 50S ribosomal protein L24 [Candidatus Melainabacteria bacterium RIFOXYA2_FULL_32_9]OGI31777.1 MAG: 50S ribosomal protein L24 [Candidatus Melainabacteria bacterium RIFOXYA12_FULL_32_12]
MASSNQKNKLHVKTGDRVLVISGKDKGKIGNIKKTLLKASRVVVEGVNIVTKAMKPNPMKNIQGGLVKLEAPINASNVMLYCSKCEKPSRIRHEVLESGRKVRVCKKCGEQVD